MSDELNLKDRIDAVIHSSKVDPHIWFQYEHLLEENPLVDLSQAKFPVIAKMTGGNVQVDGVVTRIGNIYAMRVPYSSLPELVKNNDVLYLEASR